MKQTILIILFIGLVNAQYCNYGDQCYTGCCYYGQCQEYSYCDAAIYGYDGFLIFLWVLIAIDIFVWLVYLCLYFSKRKSTMLRIGVINEKARIAFQRAQTMRQQTFQNVDTNRTQDTEVIIYK